MKLAAGRKRTEVEAVRKRLALSPRLGLVAMLIQLEPFHHCQVPWAAVAALAVMATPSRVLAVEPPLTAVVMLSVLSEKLPPKRVDTAAPVGLVLSSLTAVRLALPEVVGASLTAVIEVVIAAVVLEMAVIPPEELVLTVTLDSLVPVAEKPAV